MSDRIKALTVTLRPDMRDDDAERLADAIRFIKGVVEVVPHVEDLQQHIANENAKRELRNKIIDLL